MVNRPETSAMIMGALVEAPSSPLPSGAPGSGSSAATSSTGAAAATIVVDVTGAILTVNSTESWETVRMSLGRSGHGSASAKHTEVPRLATDRGLGAMVTDSAVSRRRLEVGTSDGTALEKLSPPASESRSS